MGNYLDLLLPELKLLVLKYAIDYKWSIVNSINNNIPITNDNNIKKFKLKTICDIIKPEKITYRTYLNDSIYFNDIKIQDKELKQIIKKYEFIDIIEHFNRNVCVFQDLLYWYEENLKFTFKFENNSIEVDINRLDYYRYLNIILITYYYKLINKKRSYRGFRYNMKNTNADTGIFEIVFK